MEKRIEQLYLSTLTRRPTPTELEKIKAFAGEDVEVAKYYPEDKEFLLEFEPNVIHYEVVGNS